MLDPDTLEVLPEHGPDDVLGDPLEARLLIFPEHTPDVAGTHVEALSGSEAAYLVGTRSAGLGDVTGGPLPALARLARRVPAYRLRYDDEAARGRGGAPPVADTLNLVPRVAPGVAVQVIDDDVLVLAGEDLTRLTGVARPGGQGRRWRAAAVAVLEEPSTTSCPEASLELVDHGAGAALPPPRPRRSERGPGRPGAARPAHGRAAGPGLPGRRGVAAAGRPPGRCAPPSPSWSSTSPTPRASPRTPPRSSARWSHRGWSSESTDWVRDFLATRRPFASARGFAREDFCGLPAAAVELGVSWKR